MLLLLPHHYQAIIAVSEKTVGMIHTSCHSQGWICHRNLIRDKRVKFKRKQFIGGKKRDMRKTTHIFKVASGLLVNFAQAWYHNSYMPRARKLKGNFKSQLLNSGYFMPDSRSSRIIKWFHYQPIDQTTSLRVCLSTCCILCVIA